MPFISVGMVLCYVVRWWSHLGVLCVDLKKCGERLGESIEIVLTTEKRKEMMCTSEKSLGTTRVLPFAGREIVGQVSVECLRFVDVHGDCTVHIMNFWSQKGCL